MLSNKYIQFDKWGRYVEYMPTELWDYDVVNEENSTDLLIVEVCIICSSTTLCTLNPDTLWWIKDLNSAFSALSYLQCLAQKTYYYCTEQ